MRQAVRETAGSYGDAILEAGGLSPRHDHASPFMPDVSRQELRLRGVPSSPAFVLEPQGHGCTEWLVRTLKEQLTWIRHFGMIEALDVALQAVRHRYNHEWLIEHHGYRSPARQRALLSAGSEVAA